MSNIRFGNIIVAGCMVAALTMFMDSGINIHAEEVATKKNVTQETTKPAKKTGLEAYEDHKVSGEKLAQENEAYSKELEAERIKINKESIDAYMKNAKSQMIDNSDKQEITTYDCWFLSKEQADIARNEIYARHGYIFSTEAYQKAFENKKWYKGVTKDMDKIKLSAVEQFNVACLKWWSQAVDQRGRMVPETGYCDCYEFKMNETINIDLNGDNKLERIVFKGIKSEYGEYNKVWLEVNGVGTKPLEGNYQEKLWVVDIDKDDTMLELVINDMGPSLDYMDHFFAYDGKKMFEMGAVGGVLNGMNYVEDKVVHAVVRSDVVGTRYLRCDYTLTKDHLLEEVPFDMLDVRVPLLVVQDIKVHSSKDKKSKVTICKKGTEVTAVQADISEWIKVEFEDGSFGWISDLEIDHYALFGRYMVD